MEIVKLGDLVEINSLKRVYLKDWKKKGIPFLKVRDILDLTNGTFNPDTFISKENFLELKYKYKFPTINNLLLTTGGTIGEVWKYTGIDCWFKDSAIRWFSIKDKRLLSDYLYLYFKKKALWARTSNSTAGGGDEG